MIVPALLLVAVCGGVVGGVVGGVAAAMWWAAAQLLGVAGPTESDAVALSVLSAGFSAIAAGLVVLAVIV